MAEVTDGLKVQAAINACYLWRGHVMRPDQVEPFLAAHGLFIESDRICVRGVFGPDNEQFCIVSAVESPYGLEIGDLSGY